MGIDEIVNECPHCGGQIVQKLIGDESFDFCPSCKRIVEGMK